MIHKQNYSSKVKLPTLLIKSYLFRKNIKSAKTINNNNNTKIKKKLINVATCK